MGVILLAIGLVLIVEGLAYALAPSLLERMLEVLRELPRQVVRQLGALCVITGLMLLWAAVQIGF